jgi:hypothetical protein
MGAEIAWDHTLKIEKIWRPAVLNCQAPRDEDRNEGLQILIDCDEIKVQINKNLAAPGCRKMLFIQPGAARFLIFLLCRWPLSFFVK